MVYILTQLSKYLLIILIAVYTFQAFGALSSRKSDESRSVLFSMQRIEIALLLFAGLISLYAVTLESMLIPYFGISLAILVFIEVIYSVVYKKAPRQLLNNMCMLLAIGFVIQARLDLDGAMRQLIITAAAAFGTILIPVLIRKLGFLDRLTWLYAAVGVITLGLVAFTATTSYGAKLSLSLAGISFQPSEFIKIVFVFFVAAIFSQATDFVTVVKATIIAAIHVLILVISKDLGAALLYFMVYLVMIYVATQKLRYFFAGLFCGSAAAVAAYFLFSHVRTRVIAWQDPFAVIDDAGYQVAQSLFAIGSGGWFGTGLGQGLPTSIPVVEEDFVFSAITEEMGALFSICMVMICLCCFILILNIAMQTHRLFHKLIALGLGTVYIFQVFLTVGGATKFIPSTGVTFPFVSIGGSSLMSTFVLFNIILGLYLFREDESVREEAQAVAPAYVQAHENEKQRRAASKRHKPKRTDYDESDYGVEIPPVQQSTAAKKHAAEQEEPLVKEVTISKKVGQSGKKKGHRYNTDRIQGDRFVNLEVTIDPDEIDDFRVNLEDDDDAKRRK